MNPRAELLELRQSWKPPAALDRTRPRLVCLTVRGKALVVLVVAMGVGALAAGVGLGILAGRQARELRMLQEEGATTDGLVTRLWRSKGGDSRQLRMAYRFTIDGRSYEHDGKISSQGWKGLQVGSHLPIRYLPSRPDLNHSLDIPDEPMPPWVPIVVAVGFAGCGLLATLPIRRQRRLLAWGRPAPGLVTHHGRTVRGSHGEELGRRYGYEFLLLSGAAAKGQTGATKNPPAIGSRITVLYDPDNPQSNAPHPFSLVR